MEEFSTYHIVCKRSHEHWNHWSYNRNKKHLPLNNTVTSIAKKLRSGTCKSRRISLRGLKFPLHRDVTFKCEEVFFESRREINKFIFIVYISRDRCQRLQSPNLSNPTQTQRCKSATCVLKPSFDILIWAKSCT